jgi:predicted nucleotidyltransferase component of viral defense system
MNKEEQYHQKVRQWMYANGMPPNMSLEDVFYEKERFMTHQQMHEAKELLDEKETLTMGVLKDEKTFVLDELKKIVKMHSYLLTSTSVMIVDLIAKLEELKRTDF